MIAVIETTMADISHEAFNAGMLYQLQKVYPGEEIIYFCEREQAKCVKRILDMHDCGKNIQFSFIERIYLDCNQREMEGNKREYINIFQQCANARAVIVLSLEAVNSGLLKNLMKKFYYIKFGICIHGYIEDILPQNDVKFEMNYRIFRAVKEYRNKKRAISYFKKNLDDMALLPNCNLILYSNIYERYEECFSPQVYQNIKVFNLPYAFTERKKISEGSNTLGIGIMPSSAAAKDQNCIKIIQYMNEQKDRIRQPYSFVIFNHFIGNYENVRYVIRHKKTRKDVEQFMELCDWMLIPYDENKYILSSSGVMFDSIETETPFFTLGSPSFYKAIGAGCGLQENTIEALAERMIWQINNGNPDYDCYCKNVKKLKWQMEKENMDKIIEIFGK